MECQKTPFELSWREEGCSSYKKFRLGVEMGDVGLETEQVKVKPSQGENPLKLEIGYWGF
jgi:hypothetical protein